MTWAAGQLRVVQTLKRIVIQLGVVLWGVIASLIGVGVLWSALTGHAGPFSLFWALLWFAQCVAAYRVFRVVGAGVVSMSGLVASDLWAIYVQEQLAGRELPVAANNPYATLSDSELVDVFQNMRREAAPERFAHLLAAIAARARETHFEDGRRFPPGSLTARRVAAPSEAQCGIHRSPAQMTCARCGTFCCAECEGADHKHCPACLEVLARP